jgi:hypothetical protein
LRGPERLPFSVLLLAVLHISGAVCADSVTPSLQILSPAPEDDWEIGAPQTIDWILKGAQAEGYKIELSRDGGAGWETLGDYRAPNATEWIWEEVTSPPSCECRLRITAVGSDCSLRAVSEGDFHIVPEDRAHESDRIFEFGGRTWGVRAASGAETEEPGSNHWGDDYDNVWIEVADGREELHLKIVKKGDIWFCTEVFTLEPTVHGPHRFYVAARVDELDPLVVAAVFLYRNDCSEIDIEFSRWGLGPSSDNFQYVVQPAEAMGNAHSSFMELSGEYTTHCIDWGENLVRFESIHGHFPRPPNTCYCIPNPFPGFCLPNTEECGWEYRGEDIPRLKKDLRVHINLWLLDTEGENAPLDGEEAEMIIRAVELPLSTD